MPTSRSSTRRDDARARQRQAEARRRKLLMGAAGIAIVGFAVTIAVLSTSETPGPSASEFSQPVAITGAALPTFGGDSTQDPAVGSPAPQVSGTSLDGADEAIGGSGRIELVGFMASWCPACQRELPAITSWLDDGGLPEDIDLILVSTMHDHTRPNWPPDEWFVTEGYDGRVLVDDESSSVADAYGLSATPFWVAVGPDGNVIIRIAGVLDRANLDALAADLVALAG